MPTANPISQSNQFEFNDSVLTTHAWNSSRYDGRQLSGQLINKARRGDVSYGRTPVLRNLTRTFYISSDVISLSNDGLRADRSSGNIVEDTFNPIEDTSLQYIPDFSYILINKSVTINEDNSITIIDLSTFNDDLDKKIGFNREFQTNIPNGSYIGIKNLDADVKDRSNVRYPVYFNQGRLQPIMRVISYDGASAFKSRVSVTQTKFLKISYNSTNTIDGTVVYLPNMAALATVATGSLIGAPILDSSLGPYEGYHSIGSNITHKVLRHLKSEANNNGIKSFITLLNTPNGGGNILDGPNIDPTTSIPPIRTISILNTSESLALNTRDLAELSTAKFADYNDYGTNNVFVTMSANNQFNQLYDLDTVEGGPANFSGSYDVSILNEEKPALLVNLIKEVEFPEGIGRTPLVIIPETLHPYIRDNIVTFMAQAGFDLGDITQINALDETNHNLS